MYNLRGILTTRDVRVHVSSYFFWDWLDNCVCHWISSVYDDGQEEVMFTSYNL